MEEINPFEKLQCGDVDYFNNNWDSDLSNFRDEKGDSLLSRAVMQQDLKCVEVICISCPSLVYCQSPNGKTALHYAAKRGYVEMVSLLINAGANANSENNRDIESQAEINPKTKLLMMIDQHKDTALHIAVTYNELETAKLLIEADPETVYDANTDGQTPLSLAMEEARSYESNPTTVPRMFKMLLETSPIQSKTHMGGERWTILHEAAEKGYLRTIKDILIFCRDCSEEVDIKGRNFLHVAAEYRQVEVVKFCIVEKKDMGLNVLNGRDYYGNTPLSFAALTENEATTLCLLTDSRIDKRLQNKHLIWALRSSNFQIIKYVCGANPGCFDLIKTDELTNFRDRDGELHLSKAVQENNFTLCDMICKKRPLLVYCEGQDRKTALHHAAKIGDDEMVRLLLRAAAGTKYEQNEDNENPKMKLLVMKDDQEDTALHIAVSNHKHGAVILLIEAAPAIDYNANINGHTPLSIAIEEARSHENNPDTGEIRRLLIQNQSSQSTQHGKEICWRSLQYAASHDDFNVTLDFINGCPACLEMSDNEGRNFIHFAAMSNSIQVVKRVLESNIVPDSVLNRRDNSGHTPFHLAARLSAQNLTECFLFSSRVNKNT